MGPGGEHRSNHQEIGSRLLGFKGTVNGVNGPPNQRTGGQNAAGKGWVEGFLSELDAVDAGCGGNVNAFVDHQQGAARV